jgi:hypothetical protein
LRGDRTFERLEVEKLRRETETGEDGDDQDA